jgi:hypothetical protein
MLKIAITKFVQKIFTQKRVDKGEKRYLKRKGSAGVGKKLYKKCLKQCFESAFCMFRSKHRLSDKYGSGTRKKFSNFVVQMK